MKMVLLCVSDHFMAYFWWATSGIPTIWWINILTFSGLHSHMLIF